MIIKKNKIIIISLIFNLGNNLSLRKMTGVSESFGLSFPKRIEYILEWNLLEKSVNGHFVVLFPYCRRIS